MTKEELMARRSEANATKAKVMANTLLVDVHCSMNTKSLHDIANYVQASVGGELKYITELISPNTSEAKYKSALTAIRLSITPKTVLIIANYNVMTWVDTYHKKGCEVIVCDMSQQKFYNYEEYQEAYGEEYILDQIAKSRYSKDRKMLEKYATVYGKALGWQFSGPIASQPLSVESVELFKPFEVLPYAGKSMYYFKDQLMESDEPSGKITITPSNKSRLLSGKGVPTSELEAFRDFLLAAVDNNLLADILEPDWALCECGYPIRLTGDTEEDSVCQYCDRVIPGFQYNSTPYYEESYEDDNEDLYSMFADDEELDTEF